MVKTLKTIGYVLLSFALAFHVFAVFISPAAMPPVSPLLLDGYELALPYNEALFLNHGYHYFAPDPGASTLISYTIPRSGDAPLVGHFQACPSGLDCYTIAISCWLRISGPLMI